MSYSKRKPKTFVAAQLFIVLFASISSIALADIRVDDYKTGQELLILEGEVSGYASMAAGLSCAAALSWTGWFTWAIAPALGGIICGIMSDTVTRTAMRCSIDENTRIRTGLGRDCVVISGGFTRKF